MLKNKKDVLRLQGDIEEIKVYINQFTEAYFNDKIIGKWLVLKELKAVEDLTSMPIDTISTLEKRMPINALMGHGLRTIYDVRNHDIYDLMDLNGVGRISAEAIVEAVAKIKASVYEQAIPRINPDELLESDLELLESIYTKWELSTHVEFVMKDIDDFNEEVGPAIQIAKKHRNFIGTLFQSKAAREKIEAAFTALNTSENKTLNNT